MSEGVLGDLSLSEVRGPRKGEEGEQVPILRAAGQVHAPARPGPLNPIAFFSGKSLWVSDHFRNMILSVAKPMDTAPETTLASFDLVRAANDTEIRPGLPKNHVFEDASAFCTHLAGMILRQPDGKLGDLLANGYVNIFYVRGAKGEVRAVHARWYSGDREWRVGAYRLGGYRWDEGDRVFSSNC